MTAVDISVKPHIAVYWKRLAAGSYYPKYVASFRLQSDNIIYGYGETAPQAYALLRAKLKGAYAAHRIADIDFPLRYC